MSPSRCGITAPRLCGIAMLILALPSFVSADTSTALGFTRMTDVMRIKSIIDGPAQGMYLAGWALMGLGLVIGTGIEQLKSFAGQPPNHGQVIARTLLAAGALACYGPFCKGVWNISAYLANTIVDSQQIDGLALGLKTMLVQGFTAVIKDQVTLAPISLIRNLILGFMMSFLTWGVSFAIDGIRVVQVSIFNVVFMFGPICLALHTMGLRAGQLWLTALLEICAWNVTIAIVTYGLAQRILDPVNGQLITNASQGALEFDWWRDMKEITFLASLILFVPAITARFFGMAALGELSRTALGGSWSQAMATSLLGLGGSRSAPKLQEQSSLGDGSDNNRRAGD